MAKKKKQECPPLPMWMTTFSDLMSLLLTFFVLLFSMSSISKEKFLKFLQTLEFMWGINIVKETKPPSPVQPGINPPFEMHPKPEKWSEVNNAVSEAKQAFSKAEIPVKEVKRAKEIILRLPADYLFDEGSYIPNSKYLPLLKRVCDLLKRLHVPIRIEGHTDSKPIYRYPKIVDNWDLSLLRAIYVAKYFIKWGFPEDKISVGGYADTEPIAPNNTPEGRAKNRRIDIVIFVGEEKI
ncbi:MAG TPA: flagellar motor protein MotB [Aquificales bacterium]|uniref:Flagellar motor protein MotB n=1 Tax=Aquifex aeolicus TaxID=63363 RepID=A0A9D1CFM2_AQUAO|nr:flagellar motor protein MotB [Aquificales bacterium]HIP98272.1 flagellar motor protein MotB [Aquifex aeolicus]